VPKSKLAPGSEIRSVLLVGAGVGELVGTAVGRAVGEEVGVGCVEGCTVGMGVGVRRGAAAVTVKLALAVVEPTVTSTL
jgi:hypothetical protein